VSGRRIQNAPFDPAKGGTQGREHITQQKIKPKTSNLKPQTSKLVFAEDGIRPFDVTGRAMKGWVMVDGGRWEDPDELLMWLTTGRDFALTLPPK